MSKADNMFLKLGYEKEIDNRDFCRYKAVEKHPALQYRDEISFIKYDKKIYVSRSYQYNDDVYEYWHEKSKNISALEIQAINQKCYELGWIDSINLI